MTLFTKRKKQSDALKVRLVDRPLCDLRLDEFRSDKNLVNLAATVLANSNMQVMLQVLRNEHPGFDVLPHGSNPNDRIIQQARSEGYEICLSNLEALGKEQLLPERLQSTFADENAV